MIAENQQLTIEDIGAGLFLIFYGLIGIIVYLIVCLAMCQMCAEIVGFRFLISQAITDMLLMIQFGIWPGIVILSKDEYLPENYRWHLHIYLDFMWWAMVYHYPMVAWSRLAAIEWPNWFRCLSHATCTAICCIPWCIALIQSVIEHQFDWFKPLYYDSDLYGLTTDWQEYNASGTGRLYSFCNVLSMILPFPFYTIAFCSIIRRNKRHSKSSVTSEKLSVTKNKYRRKDSLSAINVLIQKQLTIETRLIIPCLINTIFFVFGQIFVTLCARYSGKWITWSLVVVFASNSFINPIIYLTFSSAIRNRLHTFFRKQSESQNVYRTYDYRPSVTMSNHHQNRYSSLAVTRNEPLSQSFTNISTNDNG